MTTTTNNNNNITTINHNSNNKTNNKNKNNKKKQKQQQQLTKDVGVVAYLLAAVKFWIESGGTNCQNEIWKCMSAEEEE